jgi:hypothetical protein
MLEAIGTILAVIMALILGLIYPIWKQHKLNPKIMVNPIDFRPPFNEDSKILGFMIENKGKTTIHNLKIKVNDIFYENRGIWSFSSYFIKEIKSLQYGEVSYIRVIYTNFSRNEIQIEGSDELSTSEKRVPIKQSDFNGVSILITNDNWEPYEFVLNYIPAKKDISEAQVLITPSLKKIK